MGDSPRPSEGADASSTRDHEAPGVSSESPERSWARQVAEAQALEESSDPSWAPQVTDVREESEEMMEVGHAEDAETVVSTAPYRDPTGFL